MVTFKTLLTEGIFQKPSGWSATSKDLLLTMGKFKIFCKGTAVDSGSLEGSSISA
jgi:hypothetical protein